MPGSTHDEALNNSDSPESPNSNDSTNTEDTTANDSVHTESDDSPTVSDVQGDESGSANNEGDSDTASNDDNSAPATTTPPKKGVTKQFLVSATTLITVSIVLLANVIFGIFAGGWNNTPLGALQRTASNTILGLQGKTTTGSNGETLYSFDDTKVFRTADGLAYAPEPLREFRNKTCDLSPLNEISTLEPNSWSAPSIAKRFSEVNAEASFVEAGQNNEPIVAPDAPQGIIFEPGAQVGDLIGAILLAGHVDYAPGALSTNGGELSPWGQLHKLDSCDHVYVSNSNGDIEEFVVTSLYTEEQDSVGQNNEYFRNTGAKMLYMVTCSGASVGNAGGRFQFNYEDNLIVQAVPVQS